MIRQTRSIAAILIACTLSGCAHTRYAPIPCITEQQYQEQKAAKPPKIGDKLTGKANEDIKPITGRLIRMEGYADGLLGILEGCKGSPSASS